MPAVVPEIVRVKVTRDTGMFIPGRVEGVTVELLVDMGCSKMVFCTNKYREINPAAHPESLCQYLINC